MESRLPRIAHRITEPQILFPLSALVTLLLIWGGTWSYVRLLRADVEARSLESTQQILDTYEAQVIRSLGQIDQAMNLVTFWREHGPDARMTPLSERELLPPDLLFTISITDAGGRILDSTRAASMGSTLRTAEFQTLRAGEKVFVGRPSSDVTDGSPNLEFGRRLETPTGQFNGAVVVDVDAEYFVSGYEDRVMGQHGLLGLVGADGRLRVQRSGEQVVADGTVDFRPLLQAGGAGQGAAIMLVPGFASDNTPRWITMRAVGDFPLWVVAGLSVKEQFGALRERERSYYALAIAASLISVLALSLLGRLSWQLVRSRAREAQFRKEHAERVEYLAYHDGLTGLANRSLFSKLLSLSLADAVRYDRPLAVLYLDLDHFKAINDTLGHDAGDELLQEMARRLQSCVRASDTVARLGGDEFVVLLPQAPAEAEIAGVAEKILEAIGRSMVLLGREVRVTASIGIAMCPRDGRDEQTLKVNADAAMYQAKSQGKNNYQFYTDHLSTTSLERLSLEANLRHALERGEFRLHYQAKRDLASGRVSGMEALLRWEHPDLGIIPPMRFLPLAEESGIIIPIGRWVLRQACEQSLALRRQGLPALCVAVNLTARQFYDERLLEDIRTTLVQTGLEPWLLELEIPESALSSRPEQTRRLLLGLKEIGVRIAIGDFGMSYSSLSELRDFAFDTIKIDRSLTRSITAPAQDPALADAVISMGRRLSVTVVAQGVETRDQAEFLRLHSYDELQGYYVGMPLPPEQFAAALRAQAPLENAAPPEASEQFRAG
ncbi:MAG: EAL domain-containing protein [Pseudomonadota bacterium]